MDFLGVGVDAIDVNSFRLDNGNEKNSSMKNIPLSKIIIGNYQPRKSGVITKESIQDLVASIKENGVLQPIIVRKTAEDQYELIAGERRYHSAYEAQLHEIPCVVKEVSVKDSFAIALIENIQREQLSLLEEAESLLKLKEEYFLSVDEVSKMVGKPRTTVANLIRTASLLGCEGKAIWEKGFVDYGHIRAVITLSHEFQSRVLQVVMDKSLSVRQTEQFVRENKYLPLNTTNNKSRVEDVVKSTDSHADEHYIIKKIAVIYGKNANIKTTKSGKLKLSIEFESIEKTLTYLKEKHPLYFSV